MKEQEEWRPVPGFEGFYEVSSFGRVKGLDRIVETRPGVRCPVKGRLLRPGINANGYPSVMLRRQGRTFTKAVHKVVAMAFLSNGIVDHIDRNPMNNAVSNLRIVSLGGNAANRSHSKNYTWQYKGVIKNEYNRWRARINSKTIGSFATAEEAAMAYDAAAIALWGDLAATNAKLGLL